MAMRGETIHLGAPDFCPTCKRKLYNKPMRSAAGWYVGTSCNCGPYSRESVYYSTEAEVIEAIAHGTIDYREDNYNG